MCRLINIDFWDYNTYVPYGWHVKVNYNNTNFISHNSYKVNVLLRDNHKRIYLPLNHFVIKKYANIS